MTLTTVIEADRISAMTLVTAPKLPLKWLSARLQFRPTWFRPSFRYGCKENLVLACCHRSTALLSMPSLKRLRLCNMTALSHGLRDTDLEGRVSRRPSASGHTLNMSQLISLSCLNRQRPSVSLSVRVSVTFVHSVKTNNISSKKFHHVVATPF